METYRELQFENEHVRVWKTIIAPDQPLEMHRHQCGRVVIGLKGGKLERVEHNGKTSDLNLETHKAYWLGADSKEAAHGNINRGQEPVEVMVIEMKSVKNSPPPSQPLD